MKSLIGQKVEMRLYGGKISEFIVKGEDKNHLIVCTPQNDYDVEKRGERLKLIGIRREFLIRVV